MQTLIQLIGIATLLFTVQIASAGTEEADASPALRDEIEAHTLRPYFNALRNGNVMQIGRFITGAKRREAQLPEQEDKDFEELLRRYYKGTVFTIERAVMHGEQVVVDVRIEFPGRGRKQIRLYLQDTRGSGKGVAQASAGQGWMIADEQRMNRSHGK